MSIEKEIHKALSRHPEEQWYRFTSYVKMVDESIQIANPHLESVNKNDLTACHRYFEKRN